jgi:hypothetical protein
MITLHKFGPAWGTPDISPFCIKVETYLRMVNHRTFEAILSTPLAVRDVVLGEMAWGAAQGASVGTPTSERQHASGRRRFTITGRVCRGH